MVYSRMLHKNFKTPASRRKGEIAVANWRKGHKLRNFINTNKSQLDKDFNSPTVPKKSLNRAMKKKYSSKPKIEDHGAVAGDYRYEGKDKMYSSRVKAEQSFNKPIKRKLKQKPNISGDSDLFASEMEDSRWLD